MPRLLGKLPAYRKHKASGQAVVTLGGRDYYLGPWKSAASRAEYSRVTREWLAGGGAPAGSDLTIVELLAAFMRHAKAYYVRPDGTPTGELAGYQALVKRLNKAYGRTLAKNFGPLAFKAFRQMLIDETAEGEARERKLCRTTINQTMNRVRHVFKWGVENELVAASVFDALRCVAGLRFGKTAARETDRVKPVPDAFVDAIRPYVTPHVWAMIELQRVTGMRSGEVCQMRMCDINTAGSVWTYTPQSHKTQYRGHARVVYLGPKAQEILRPWLRTNLEECLFQPAEAEAWRQEQRHAKRKTPLSCGNRPGSNRQRKAKRKPSHAYTADTYGNAITYAIKRCNRDREQQGQEPIPAWHPHQLRHNAGTLYRREYGLEVARVLLGHRHAAITEIYAEADQQRAVEVVAKIG